MSEQCEFITRKGSRCSRNALPGERYCTQHLKIINEAMVPGVVLNILEFSGARAGINTITQKLLYKKEIDILRDWFHRIRVTYNIDNLDRKLVPELMSFYKNRNKVDERPDLWIGNNLSFIFYSEYHIVDNIKDKSIPKEL